MNFRKEDLNLGRLQKLRKEVFPDAPGDYEKALCFSTAWSGYLMVIWVQPKGFARFRKRCFFRSTRNTLKTHFCSKKIIFLSWIWWIFRVGIHIFEKNARPWRWIHPCLGRIFRFHVVIPRHCICSNVLLHCSQLDEHLWNLREEQFVWMHAQDW